MNALVRIPRRRAILAVVAATFALLALPGPASATPDQVGEWGSVMDWGIQGKHMAMLPTGDVLVFSTGENARVWDPETGTFTLAPALFGDLHCAGHATLRDGRIIVLGGQGGGTHIGTTVTAIFDPFTGTWTSGTPMTYGRWYASVTTLADGRILGTSGDDPNGQRVNVPEVYDPDTNSWTLLTTAARSQSLYPLMYVLPDGRVFESGPKASTAILDPSGTGSWTTGPTNFYSTSGYSESSAMFEPGKVLRSGGGDPAIARTTVIDMTSASPQWQETAAMSFPRRRHNLVILADGQVMAVGGTRQSDSETAAILEGEIWDPATMQWTTVAAMAEARMYHSSAVLLPDGRVLAAGGEAAGRLRAQIYSPPYLFKGPRPTITAAPATAGYGSTFVVTTPDAASIAQVGLIRSGAATHAWDQNQRYVPLSFSQESGALRVNAPAGPGYAPPGYYMLVIEDANGVPSVAAWVRIDTAGSLTPGAIAGIVTDSATGLPVPGAQVSVGALGTTTAADGTYTVADVPAGEHQVQVSAAGYATAIRASTVVGGETTTLDFGLSAPGAVSGVVTDSSTGSAIAGAVLTYLGGSTTTDAAGAYSIAGLPAGDLTITASATGYDSLGQTATIVPGTTATLNFTLVGTSTFITGTVVAAGTLEPLVGATVSTTGATGTTDSLGRYRLDVPPGNYTVTASSLGYTAFSQPVVLTPGTYAVSDFALTQAPAGTPIKSITFEGGSLTGGTSGADKVSGSVTLGTAAPLSGAYSARIAGAGSAYLEESFTATDDLFVVCLLRLNANTSGDARIVQITAGGSTVGTLQLRPSGKLRLRDGSTTIGSESSALALGELYRIGVHQKKGAGSNAVLEAFLASGVDPFGAPFATTSAGKWTAAASRIRVGATTGTSVNLVLDDILLDAASMPGGGGGGGPPPPPVAAFTAAPTAGTSPLAVSFTDTSTGTPTSWSWTFGDGGTSSVQNPTHTYSSPGSYDVTLTVTNGAGPDSETKTGLVTVTAPDVTAPSVTGTAPSGTGVSVSTDVAATFSEEVVGVNGSTFMLAPTGGGPAVAATVTYSSASDTATLDPTSSLAANTSYTATLTGGITDLALHSLADAPLTWSFTTGDAPPPPSGVIAVNGPAISATAASGSTVTLPSWSPDPGDLILVAVAQRDESKAISVSGNGLAWTEIANVDNVQGQGGISLWWARGPAPTTGSITVTVTGNTLPVSVVAQRFSGVAGSTPIEAAVTNRGPAADNASMLGSVTTATPGAWAVAAAWHRNQTFTVPAGETALLTNRIAGSSGNTTRASMWYEGPVSEPGSVQLGAAGDLSQIGDWAMIVVSLAPA